MFAIMVLVNYILVKTTIHKCIYRPVKQSKEELILLGIREHFWNETKLTSDQTKQ